MNPGNTPYLTNVNSQPLDVKLDKVLEEIKVRSKMENILKEMRSEIGLPPTGKYIQGIELTSSHIGLSVLYVPRHAHGDTNHKDCEKGKIKSWNEGGVFVDYKRNVCRTDFNDLIFIRPEIGISVSFS
jgi:hypothetical protein